MKNRRQKKSFIDAYCIPDFKTCKRVKGLFGDKTSLVVTLLRRQKKPFAVSAQPVITRFTIAKGSLRGTSVPVDDVCIWNSSIGVFTAWCVVR
jgi:hypothetical protein